MKYIAKKLIALIITLFIVSLLAFLAFQVIPGDPTTSLLGTSATPQQVAELRSELGLDRPVIERYADWLVNFLRGDMGTSYSYKMAVSSMISVKLPITLILTAMAFVMTVAVSIPLGIYAARKEGGVIDRCITVLDQIVMSVPPFFIGILCCWIFGIILRMFTPGAFVSYTKDLPAFIIYMIFPALSIAVPRIAMTVKMLRSSILEQMGQDYVRTAYSRGNSRKTALQRHVLRNALIPVVTFIAVSVAEMLAGSIIIEQVFTIPGIGRLLLTSISSRDFPVVQAIVVILAFWVVAVNFIADVLYQYIDPRIRLG
jgi:peptide/nickel transport system permease protein